MNAQTRLDGAGQTRWRRGLTKLWHQYDLYLMVLAPVAYVILFKYVPMYGAQIAFRQYQPVRGILGSPWVGLKYIRQFFGYYQFSQLLGNTIILSLYSLATFPLSIVLAILLNNLPSARFRKAVQMISYAPHFITTVVMCGMILQFLDLRGGLLNALFRAVGRQPVQLMANSGAFYGIYVWSGVWQGVGYGSIIYISALAGVSPELHEAAIMDGATLLQRIWHVDLPAILPTISILLVLRCGSLLSTGYEKILLLQNSLNIHTSEVIDTYVYKIGLLSSLPQYSYSTAIGLFVSVINVLLLILVNGITRRLNGNSLW